MEMDHATDDAWLDEFFDEAVRRAAHGPALDPEEAAARRPDLRPEIDRCVRLAGLVAVQRPASAPTLRGYEIVHVLGHGSGGIVYLARQEGLGRRVALKVLAPALAAVPEARTRFLSEARALARVSHSGIVEVFEVIDAGPVLAYAMEWVDGWTLREVLWALRPLENGSAPPARGPRPEGLPIPEDGALVPWVCRMAAGLARSLAAVHAAGLVHRDVKPSNILIDRSGRAKLSDFGLVRDPVAPRATVTGRFLGTLGYSAPEQLRGFAVGPAADVFGLGAVVFEALVGRPPFSGASPAEALRAIDGGLARIRRPGIRIPRDLETVVAAALDPDPARRQPNAAAMADDLERVLEFRPVLSKPQPIARRARLWIRRNRMAVLATFAIAALVAAAGLVSWRIAAMSSREEAARPGRIEAHLAAARLLLLDPAHRERIFSVAISDGTFPDPPDAARVLLFRDALAEYDRALALDPGGRRAREEREAVSLAATVIAGEESWENARSLLAGRAFSLGFAAFLIGRSEECLVSWEPWDASVAVPDPFVDAAVGEALLALGRPAAAYARLLAGCRAFPEAGFLLVDMADAARLSGEPARALDLVREARRIGRLDTWATDERVEGECLADLGDLESARRVLERVNQHFDGSQKRLALARVLLRLGDAPGALAAARDAFGRARVPATAQVFVAAHSRIWASETGPDRVARLAGALDTTSADAGDLRALDSAIRLLEKNPTDPVAVASPPGQAGQDLPAPDVVLISETTAMLARIRTAPKQQGRRAAAILARIAVRGFARLGSRPRRWTALALAALASAGAPTYAQTAPFDLDFEFSRPGELPTSHPNVLLYSAGVGSPFVQSCGQLQLRSLSNGNAGALAYYHGGINPDPGLPATPITFDAAFPVVVEIRRTNIAASGYFGDIRVLFAPYRFHLAFYTNGTAGFSTAAGETQVPVAGFVGQPHTFRMEYDPAPPVVRFYVDGVLAVGPFAPLDTTFNGFYFGDPAGGANNNCDVDWDYVRIHNGPIGVGQRNSESAVLEVNRISGAARGPHVITGLSGQSLTLTWAGPPGMPYVLAAAQANPAHEQLGCIGRLDIGIPPYLDLQFIFNGASPFFGPIFSLDACGTAMQTFTIPPLPPGTPLGNLQGLVIQAPGSPCPAFLTAAFYLGA